MSSCEQGESASGLQKIELQNRYVRLSILPAAGGKISELVDQQSGHNWLWHNPHVPFSNAVYDVDFGRHLDSGGWDEILLSTSAAKIQFEGGAVCRIPDHGDVVGQEWTVVDAGTNSSGDASCEMSVCGRALKYEFTRVIRLRHDNPALEVSYSLVNQDSFAWPWYWSLHALVTGERDLKIELPVEQEFRIDHVAGMDYDSTRDRYSWPHLPLLGHKSLDLSRSFESDNTRPGFASKIFVRSPDSGQVCLRARDSTDKLNVRYDPIELPWLGLWINNDGWSGCDSKPYRNLGIEPATAAFDSISTAIEDGSLAWLQPEERREWAISVDFQS